MVFVKGDDWARRGANRNQPIPAYLVVKTGTGRQARYDVINARTAQLTRGMTQTEFEQLELKKLNTEQLQTKANVTTNDWVFVKEHKTLMGFIMMVAYITPASNTRPGVYVKMPRGERDIHITRANSLYKVTPAATNEWVVSFDNFERI
jgi:hypothetical protein